MEVIRREAIDADDASGGRSRSGSGSGSARPTPNTIEDARRGVKNARKDTHWRRRRHRHARPAHRTARGADESSSPADDLIVVEDDREPDAARTARDQLGTCEFSRKQAPDEGLPVVVVDEEIYRLLPRS